MSQPTLSPPPTPARSRDTFPSPSEAEVPPARPAPPGAPPAFPDVSNEPPEIAVAALVEHAVDVGCSDLFFTADDEGLTIKVRHLGLIRDLARLPEELGRRCQGHIKANSSVDWGERRRPLDGRWIYRRRDGRVTDLRIGVIPTLHGEDIAIRLLSRDSALLHLDLLGMTAEQRSNYETMIDSPGGLVLITGPTGSGKTSTLYASLVRLNSGTRKINTIEDPVEYAIAGLHQSQVNPMIDLGFAELLRSVLRQNPDIIMLGEIRDPDTAQLAVHAANTGILVLATLHAQSASGAIQSMRSLGAHPHLLASSLRGVVAQRLVRTLCPHCLTTFDLSDAPHTFGDVRRWLKDDEGRLLHAASGCPACSMTGFTGRTGVFEVLPATPALRDLVANARPAAEVHAQALADGMLPFRHAALLQVARGRTTTEEIFRAIPTEQLLHNT
jgi:type II secretory ATPase GspE/PulE/Tfp pilus assembly ATPase PilB-like protein